MSAVNRRTAGGAAMSEREGEALHQCPTCPWRVDCDPMQDIPNGYSVELHAALQKTIARPGEVNIGEPLQIMACHYSKPGEEYPCAGWMANQLGDGNNIALRIAVIRGRLPMPEVESPQHERFEETLP